jgi:hypothetical protein
MRSAPDGYRAPQACADAVNHCKSKKAPEFVREERIPSTGDRQAVFVCGGDEPKKNGGCGTVHIVIQDDSSATKGGLE